MARRLILPLLALTACTGGPEREREAAEAILDSHRATLQALGAPTPAPRPRAAAPHAGHPHQAASLLGATPEAVRAALGEPMLRRAEGPAQVWLYSGGGCQLDIVLYAGASGPRVAHVQARAGGLAQRSEASCLRDISAQAANSRHAAPPRPDPLPVPAPLAAPLAEEAGSDA
ncbi:hypothetical protein KTR66_12115 [Roseococcus sp. SDR]|uniref:hypothetical protein n=1 Tax=Roseococcus sp. SDR TaxID=2835532 RepID=UPI001BCC92C2|nr:hypothetical protein [Roseococcus sp. SDR]MBS7790747.1 hypothetical protein [Roseococcus sp. SDR]MBV1846061.1 hypothetical protein [Roseococcus sp. SDR]